MYESFPASNFYLIHFFFFSLSYFYCSKLCSMRKKLLVYGEKSKEKHKERKKVTQEEYCFIIFCFFVDRTVYCECALVLNYWYFIKFQTRSELRKSLRCRKIILAYLVNLFFCGLCWCVKREWKEFFILENTGSVERIVKLCKVCFVYRTSNEWI